MSLLSKGKMKVIYQILRINLRTSVITLIGFSIALSTITTSVIYLETNRANYYVSLFEQDNFHNDVIYTHNPTDLQAFENSADILSLQQGLDQKISERGLEKVLVKHPWYPICSLDKTLHFLNQTESPAFYGINFNESILADCVVGSYLPTNMNETILLTPSLSGLNIGDYYNISIHLGETEYYSHTLRISGLITNETLGNSSLLKEFFPYFDSHQKIRILTNLEGFVNLTKNIDTKIDSSSNKHGLAISLYFRIDIQDFSFNTENVVKRVETLVSFFSETETFYLNGNYLSRVYRFNITALIHNIDSYNVSFFSVLFLCIPAFIATVLLVKFSGGVINERRKKSLFLFRMRGVSPKFLFNALLLEMVVISLIAALISIILGTCGYFLFSATTGYLTFDFEKLSFMVIIPPLLLPFLIILSVGFTFLTSFQSMRQLSKSKLVLLDQEITGTKNTKPRSIVRKINTLLFVQGLSGIFILIFLLQLINGSKLEIGVPALFNLLLPVIIVLLVLSPLSFLVGFILTYNWFIPLLIKKIGNYCWKKDRGLVATVFRNLSVNYKIAGQVTLLIACTLSFLMILSSLPVSFSHFTVDAAYYGNGAEISIQIGEDEPIILQELQTQLTSIQGVKFTTISHNQFTLKGNDGISQTIRLYGIEENFHQVAYWQKYYDDQPLPELVHALFNSTESLPIILDSNTAQKEDLTPNDRYQPFRTDPNTIAFSVEGVSDYWPGFIYKQDINFRYLIVPRDFLENITKIMRNSSEVVIYGTIADSLLCKVSPGYELEVVVNQILTVTKSIDDSLNVETARSIADINQQSIFTRFYWLIVNFNFLDSLGVVLIVITLFTLLRMSSHTTEIGLSRALGMKHNQVFLLMFLEPLILFLLGGIPGGVVGSLFLILFASIMSPLLVPAPPFILEFNLHAILSVYAVIFFVTVAMGIITSLMATRSDISKLLKVE